MPKILRISVYDHPGVVDRITGLIRRNGWNISGINAGEMTQGVSKINILLRQRDVDISMIGNNLSSLDCVKEWELCTVETHYIRELFAFTVNKADYQANPLEGARVVEEEAGVLFVEYTATPREIDQVLEERSGQMLDFVRTGVISITRGGGQA